MAKGLREAEAFQRELLAFQRRITETGHSAFEGVGSHDDLVIAAALVCWWMEKVNQAVQGGFSGVSAPVYCGNEP